MSVSSLIQTVLLVFVLTVFGVQTLCAAETTRIIKNLTPQSGVVVIQTGDEFLIDLDASKGIQVGDLVSVMQKGEKVIHPVTQEVIGTLDAVKALLRVTRIRDGYSHAALLFGDEKVTKGDLVRSYTGIAATFFDETGKGESLYGKLRAGLPDLEWQPYTLTPTKKLQELVQNPDYKGLFFVLTDQQLELRDNANQQIRVYPLAATLLPAAPAILTANLPAAPDNGIIQVKKSAQDGLFIGPDMVGLVVGVAVGDFNGDGQQEVATAFADKLVFGRVSNKEYHQTGSLQIDNDTRLLSVVAVDLDKDGRDELYLTAAQKKIVADTEQIASLYVEFIDGRWDVRQTGIPYLFGAVVSPGEGRILIGQRPGEPGRTYSSSVYRFEKQKEKIVRGEKFKLPTDKATVHGLAVITDAASQPLYLLLDLNEKLQVYSSAGDRLWESGEIMGGTEVYFVRRATEERIGDSVHDYLKAHLDLTADDLIVVPTNEGSTRMFKTREFSKSFLTAYRWDGRSLQEEWKTAPQGGSLAGFTYADVDNDGRNELVPAVIFNHGSVLSPDLTNSALVIYELP